MEINGEGRIGNEIKDCEFDRTAAYWPPSDEVKQSWLLRPEIDIKKKMRIRCLNPVVVKTLVVAVLMSVVVVVVAVTAARRFHRRGAVVSAEDNCTVALRKALFFFDAQRSGKLPKNNGIPWRGDSCLHDEVTGGYYDGGNANKFTFQASFAMTMLSWSVIEYRAKYEAMGELNHVKNIIKWGSDYLLRTFDSSGGSINSIVSRIVSEECWIPPENINHQRQADRCYDCPSLAAEMAAALAATSIVFNDNMNYSKKLVHGAELLFKFATRNQGENFPHTWFNHNNRQMSDTTLKDFTESDMSAPFYNSSSSSYWDEIVWGSTWLYYATGNMTYLRLATNPNIAKRSIAFWRGKSHGVFSWDNKNVGVQLLLTRVRFFSGYGYPYEFILGKFNEQIGNIMCSYLPSFRTFNRTIGGLIELSYGNPKPLQYVANAAFLATLYSDYLGATLTPSWGCGKRVHSKEHLRAFAKSQIDYILGKNPQKISYIVGYGDHYPKHAHHIRASIPGNKTGPISCKMGMKWMNDRNPNPHVLEGAMVGGPDKFEHFLDIRINYNYTEPSLAGNAGLVAALVALSGKSDAGVDVNFINSAVQGFSELLPPPAPLDY